MDDSINQHEQKLRDELYGAIDEVGAALESGERERQLAAGALVDPLVARYQEFLRAAPEAERDKIERTIGRLLTDLRRTAGQLTKQQTGRKAERAADGGLPFLLTRAPSPFLIKQAPPAPRRSNSTQASVGSEIEAWCGKCKESRTHRVVVVKDGKPNRVQCVHCKSQHGFREEPSARSAEKPVRVAQKRQVDPEAVRRREEREKLVAELDSATEVKPFDSAATYRMGQVVNHPKHGRGKVESVTRGSILIRFLDGLRPISRT